MIHRLSKRIADFLLGKGAIPQSEIDICIYGYETILSGIADLAIVLAVGFLSKQLLVMLLFFVMFISVRLYTGGYHAETFLGCKASFTLICLSVALISELPFSEISFFPVLCILIMLLFVITCVYLAPVENHNKPLTKKEQTKYHKISIAISLFWTAVAAFTYFFAIKICFIITLTALLIMLLMFVGQYGKEESSDENQQDL